VKTFSYRLWAEYQINPIKIFYLKHKAHRTHTHTQARAHTHTHNTHTGNKQKDTKSA